MWEPLAALPFSLRKHGPCEEVEKGEQAGGDRSATAKTVVQVQREGNGKGKTRDTDTEAVEVEDLGPRRQAVEPVAQFLASLNCGLENNTDVLVKVGFGEALEASGIPLLHHRKIAHEHELQQREGGGDGKGKTRRRLKI